MFYKTGSSSPFCIKGDGVSEIFVCPRCGKEYKTEKGLLAHVEARHPPTPEELLNLVKQDPLGAVLLEMIQATRQESINARQELQDSFQAVINDIAGKSSFDKLLENHSWLQAPIQETITKLPGLLERAVSGEQAYSPEVMESVRVNLELDRQRKEKTFNLIDGVLERGNRLVELSPDRYRELQESGVIEAEPEDVPSE